ncbi:ATP-dependent RNA helicase DDX31/DBP7 [Strigomonas culicis]|uniref:ATP-dependent RNA helicase n=1 Tax=Strigomonas culicis TaxID=28005 RepID=S9VAY3_9TRYP|nr:ATP-dependent RNA helicase DDX31/DBP7 [Strigomonas culicis]|eukprot:EPY24176.1 ATP-dependent RNA helicase DDX31/DBP7 [Strigomonas culicis]
MSFLSVSGLAGSENNALAHLRSASSGDTSNPLLDAIAKVQQSNDEENKEPEFLKPKVPSVPQPKTAPRAGQPKAAPAAAPAPQRAPATSVPKTMAPRGEKPSGGFKADNPTDADDLPCLEKLVHSKLLRPLCETMKIEQLTRIQKLCWVAMSKRDTDVLIRSETGSGKTLAYALPALDFILRECDRKPISRDTGTILIIMCPTRELVLQVNATLSTLLRCAQFLTVGGIHGGENRHKEKARLRKGMPVLVCTPGRLLDHLKATSSFNIGNLQTIVMDEADRLLDLGFEKPIREIMELLSKKCEHFGTLKRVLVSATITDSIERLSHFALRPSVQRLGETEDAFTIPATLHQHFAAVPIKHRLAVLISFIRAQFDAGANKIVVFVATADCAEFLYYLLSRLQSPFKTVRKEEGRAEPPRAHGMSTRKMVQAANQHLIDHSDDVVTFDEEGDDDAFANEESDTLLQQERRNAFLNVNVFKLHGNMSQTDRASVFHAFKHGASSAHAPTDKGVIFCTDVAARGLDMPRIDWIVHYDPPSDPTCYVHRVGRTARIGNTGDSILFLAPLQIGYAEYLSNFIQGHMQGGKMVDSHKMTEKKYETYLFYLTKLDTKSNHSWPQSTATLERAVGRQVTGRSDGDGNDSHDNLNRIAFFAYQSYVRFYAGLPRDVKNLFFRDDLHLGHVAQSFGIDKSPSEVQRELQRFVKEDRIIARDNRKGTATYSSQDRSGAHAKRQRIELDHDDRYRSMLAQKQRKLTRDWAEKRREESTKIKPLQFSEFDA